jgi:ABC-2 type transport system permease protein
MRVLAKLTWVELKLFLREPFAVIFSFVFPVVVLVVLAGIFGNEADEAFPGTNPQAYYLAGYIAVVVSAIGLIAVPVHVAGYRERGILRRFQASSVPVWKVLGAQVLVGLIMSVVGVLVLVAVGTLVYDAGLPDSYGGVALALLVGSLSVLTMGFLLASLLPTARSAQAAGMILFFPMWLLSGAGPPPAVLTEGMRTVSDALPLSYVVRALQDPWLGTGSNRPELLLLAGIMVVAGALSVRLARSV